MKTLFMINAKLAFLRETAQHYTSENRGVVVGYALCQYSPVFNPDGTIKSCGCAIGRHVPNKVICAEMDQMGGTVQHPNVWKKIGTLQVLGAKFLRSIQCLHDSKQNWCSTGLSDEGKEHFRRINELVLNGKI